MDQKIKLVTVTVDDERNGITIYEFKDENEAWSFIFKESIVIVSGTRTYIQGVA